jgi:uncharacterized protein (TIGR04255 family)
MTLPPHEWVRFRKTPLRLVIGQVRFTIMPRFGQDAFIAGFQEAIRTDYPKVSREAAMTFQLSPAGVQTEAGEKLWRFSSRDLLWSVVVSESAITLEARKYSTMKDFLARFHSVLEAAKEQLEITDRLRLGLRYVNEIRYNEAKKLSDWREFLNAEFVGFDVSELLGGQVNHTIQEIQVNRSDGILAIRHGLLSGSVVAPLGSDRAETGQFYLIDLDYYDMGEYDLDIPSTLRQMQAYNDVMYQFFRWTLKDKLYDYLEPEHAQHS